MNTQKRRKPARWNNLIYRLALGGIAAAVVVLLAGFASSDRASSYPLEAAPNQQASLPSGITHHWKHDEGSGTTIADSVGSADLTLKGTATNFWDRTDVDGTAVGQYNGSDNSADDDGGNFTWPTGDFWGIAALRVDEGTNIASQEGVFGARNGTGMQLRLRNGQAFRFLMVNGSTLVLDYGITSQMLWGTWLIVQFGYEDSSGDVFLRVQNREVTDTGASVPSEPSATFKIGNDQDNSRFLGRIGEVVWYNGKFPTEQEKEEAFDALWSKYNGPDITVANTDDDINPTINSGPFDGEAHRVSRGEHTLIMSGSDDVYVARLMGRDATNQIRVARLNKSYVVQEDVQSDTAGVDSSLGHNGPAVAVDTSGNVVVSSKIDDVWNLKHTTTANDLSTLTASTRPDGVGELNEFTRWRMFLDPDNNEIYALATAESAGPGLGMFKFDSSTKTWSVVGNYPFANDGSDTRTHSGMAFHTSGETTTVYLVIGQNNGAGYEMDNVRAYKSTDGGDNWTDLLGNAVTLPAGSSTGAVFTSVIPVLGSASAERPNLILDSEGNPMVVAPWQNELESETNLSWYLFRWNSTAQTFTRHKLVGASESVYAGFHNFMKGPEAESVFVYLDPADSILKVLATEDDGDTWTRWILDDVSSNPTQLSGDQRSIAVDGVYRMLTYRHDDTNLDSATEGDTSETEIYEFSITSQGEPDPTPTPTPTPTPEPTCAITTTSLPRATPEEPYSTTLQANAACVEPLTWSIISGSLPDGITLNGSTGEISGTTEEEGTFNFTVQVEDDESETDTQGLSLAVSLLSTSDLLGTLRGLTVVGMGLTLVLAPFGLIVFRQVTIGSSMDQNQRMLELGAGALTSGLLLLVGLAFLPILMGLGG